MFFVLYFLFYLSQLFIIAPGSDITGIRGSVHLITTIGGLSYTSILCIFLIAYCLILIFIKKKRMFAQNKNDIIVLWAIVSFFTIGFAISTENFGIVTASEFSLKILMPFVFYYFMKYSFDVNKLKTFYKTILLINTMLIGQIVVCKVLTGSFSASKYYWYFMEEEYFGYYNSPHPFAAVLGLLSIWNAKCIIQKEKKVINAILIMCNFVLIVLSGVRSYIAAVVVSLLFILAMLFVSNKVKYFKSLVISMIIISFALSNFLTEYILTSRLSTLFDKAKVYSGRDERWSADLAYYVNNYDVVEKLFGGGFKSIYLLNFSLFGVEINSLNVFIDLLIDNGIVGMCLFLIAYIAIFKWCFTEYTDTIWLSIAMFLFIGLSINNLLPYVTVMPLAIMFVVVHKMERIYPSLALKFPVKRLTIRF